MIPIANWIKRIFKAFCNMVPPFPSKRTTHNSHSHLMLQPSRIMYNFSVFQPFPAVVFVHAISSRISFPYIFCWNPTYPSWVFLKPTSFSTFFMTSQLGHCFWTPHLYLFWSSKKSHLLGHYHVSGIVLSNLLILCSATPTMTLWSKYCYASFCRWRHITGCGPQGANSESSLQRVY